MRGRDDTDKDDDVAALASRVRPAPEGLALAGVVDKGARVGTGHQDREGRPGLGKVREIGYVDLLDLVELVVEIEEATETEGDDEQHDHSAGDHGALGPPPALGRAGSVTAPVGRRCPPAGCLLAAGSTAGHGAAEVG